MSIAHLGDLLIRGSDLCIEFFPYKLGDERGVNAFGENESNYLCMKIKKAANEFSGEWGIFDGDRTFPGVTSGSDNYEGWWWGVKTYLFYPVERKNGRTVNGGRPSHIALRIGGINAGCSSSWA